MIMIQPKKRALMNESLRVCVDIAEKLKDPSGVHQALLTLPQAHSYLHESWPNPSLSSGLTSIIVLYAVLDEILPNQGWDERANEYIKLCVANIETNGLNGFSLFEGLAGVCYSVFLASKNGTRYQQLLSKLEKFLVDQLELSFFNQVDQILKENKTAHPHFYGFSSGICGVLAYLLIRRDNPALQKLASDCLYSLVRLLSQKQVVDGVKVPGWVSEGSFYLDRTNGITGCLSVLSNASLEGNAVSGQYELISEIADWLKNQKIQTEYGPAWSYILPLENSPNKELRDIWNFGAPAVASSLFLAGKATKNQKLMEFAEEALIPVYTKAWQERRQMGPSFISGRAGLLVVTSQMARLTGNPFFQEQIPLLTEDLLRFYSPNHRFGFQTVYYTQEDDGYQWIDHPGLWEGAVGVALSLLMASQNESKDWQMIFLAN